MARKVILQREGPTRVAVIGAGWAGLATAVRAIEAGYIVTLFERAPMPGGRARSDGGATDVDTDNGQHVLLRGYERSRALMQTVGIDPDQVMRPLGLPLRLPDGRGLKLEPGKTGVLHWFKAWRHSGVLSRADGWAAIKMLLNWHEREFQCPINWSAEQLWQRTGATPAVQQWLLEPLCISAMNVSPKLASARVWLAIMKECLLGPTNGGELMLPTVPLGRLLPTAAIDWLQRHGASVRIGSRVNQIHPGQTYRWQVFSSGHRNAAVEGYDCVVLACSPKDACRLMAPVIPSWAGMAGAMRDHAIATIRLRTPPLPPTGPAWMLRHDEHHRPAQFAFQSHQDPRVVSMVVSCADDWALKGRPELIRSGEFQLREAFGWDPGTDLDVVDVRIEQHATIRSEISSLRPGNELLDGLLAAGDYLRGPWPASLETAVRTGEAAVARMSDPRHMARVFTMRE